jgi:hypothetical protein
MAMLATLGGRTVALGWWWIKSSTFLKIFLLHPKEIHYNLLAGLFDIDSFFVKASKSSCL